MSAVVVTVNGQETERVVLSEEVITEPVPQVMTEGDDGRGDLQRQLFWRHRQRGN